MKALKQFVPLCVLLVLSSQQWSEVDAQQCKADTQGDGKFNKNCVFPFRWNGRMYNACTTADNGNTPWCFHQGGTNWGHCERTPECLNPGSVNTPPTPTTPVTPPTPTFPQPTRPPTRSPTKPPTNNPTRSPTPAPLTPEPTTAAPTTAPPSGRPTPAPTPETPKPQGELLGVQLSPFTISLMLNRRLLTEHGEEQTDELFELMYNFLLPYYASVLTQPLASLELTVLNQSPEEEDFLTRFVMGTAFFVTDPPSRSEVDEATRDALNSQEFLQEVQASDDPVLARTEDVQIVSGFIEESQDGSSGDDGNKGLFAFSILAAIICGLGAIAIFAYVIRMNYNKKEQQIQEAQIFAGDHDLGFAEPKKVPDTPSTDVSNNDSRDSPRNSMAAPPESAVGTAPDSESVLSFLKDETSVSNIGGSSVGGDKSYGFPDDDLW